MNIENVEVGSIGLNGSRVGGETTDMWRLGDHRCGGWVSRDVKVG